MSGSPSPRRPLRSCRGARPGRAAAAGVPETIARFNDTRGLRGSCVAALLARTLAGCAETGDFGRPRHSTWNDLVLPAAGSLAVKAPWEPVSPYVFTDDEEELRDRAWRFLMPAHERSRFEGVVIAILRARGLPDDLDPADKTAYHRALMGGSFRSPASRYRRLSEDALADLKLIGPFASRASRVIAADRVRLSSLAYVRDIGEAHVRYALERVADNRCLIAWVRHETYGRLASYRYALELLVVEAPQSEAVAAERTLAGLESHSRTLAMLVGPASQGVLCASSDVEASRVQPALSLADLPPASEPLVVKD